MPVLQIETGSGDRTCFNKSTRKWCKFYGTVRFGQIPVCMLFPGGDGEPVTLLETSKPNLEGWVLRCKKCVDSTMGGVNATKI